MAQNPKVSIYKGQTQNIDYIPASAVNAGDVIVLGGIPHFSQSDIAASVQGSLAFDGAIWKGNKATGGWTINAPVYYDPSASPNVGTASTGAFTQTQSPTTILAGYAKMTPGGSTAAASGDQYGYFVKANPVIGQTGNGAAQTVAAAGTTQGTAAALGVGFNFVTGANASAGVLLPPAGVGVSCEVKNSDAANAILKVYPPGAGTINALSASAAISMAAKTSAKFVCLDGVQWFTIPLVPS